MQNMCQVNKCLPHSEIKVIAAIRGAIFYSRYPNFGFQKSLLRKSPQLNNKQVGPRALTSSESQGEKWEIVAWDSHMPDEV